MVAKVGNLVLPSGHAGAQAVDEDHPGAVISSDLVSDFGSVEGSGAFGDQVGGGHGEGLFDGPGNPARRKWVVRWGRVALVAYGVRSWVSCADFNADWVLLG